MSLPVLIVVFLVAGVAQTTLINAFAVFGVTPDMILCLTLTIVFLYEGGYRCIPFGLAASLLAASTTEDIIGVGALLLFGAGIGIYIYRKYVRVDNILSLLAYCAGITAVYQLFYWMIYKVLGNDISILVVLQSMPMSVIYNTAFAALLFVIMKDKAEAHTNDRYYI